MVSPWHGIIGAVADSFPGLAKGVNSVDSVNNVNSVRMSHWTVAMPYGEGFQLLGPLISCI